MQLEHHVGNIIFKGKELTETRDGKVVLNNHLDYSEFLGMVMLELIINMAELSEAINQLKTDMRKLRVGQEAFVYGEKVEESDEVDQEELEDMEGGISNES